MAMGFVFYCVLGWSLTVTCRSASGGSMEQVFPIAKMAELKKLKTGSGDRHVLGAEISSVGVSGGTLSS